MQRTKRNRLMWCSSAVAILVASCYHLENSVVVMTNAPTWTGAGHASVGSASSPGRALGLAGEDIYVGSTASMVLYDSPFLPELGAGYTLTGIAQTHTMGFHENTFLHAYAAGDVGSLDLFLVTGFNFNSYTRIVSTSPWFVESGTIYELTQICDMAGVPIPAYGLPSDEDSHLYLSVRACSMGDSPVCVGGVVEADFSATANEWGVKNSGGWQAAIRKADGSLYSEECMPISATGLGDTSVHYLALGDPSADELALYEVGQLDQPPVSTRHLPHANQNIRDLVLEGRGDGTTDYGFLAVLWNGSGGTAIEHVLATNGTIGSGAFLTEPVLNTTRFIHSTGAGGKPANNRADMYTFGTRVYRRTYLQN
jgi:hypothetical protein